MTDIESVYEELKSIESPNPDMETMCPKTIQFINNQKFNADIYEEVLTELSVIDHSKIDSAIVGYSGSGELLELISNHLEISQTIGIDDRKALLNRKHNNVSDAIIINNQPQSISLNHQADLYTLLGGGLSNIPSNELSDMFRTVYDSLTANGVFLANFVNSVHIGTGEYVEESFTQENGELHHQKISSRKGNQLMQIDRYHVNTKTSPNPVSVTTHSTQYIHEPYQLKEQLKRAGFLKVSLTKEGPFASPKNPLVIAWK